MLFTSGTFLFLYLPITLAGFFAISRLLGHSSGAAWLVAASLVFYGYWHSPHTAARRVDRIQLRDGDFYSPCQKPRSPVTASPPCTCGCCKPRLARLLQVRRFSDPNAE